MKRLIYLYIMLMLPVSVLATGQVAERLIWNGDTLMMFSLPLELRSDRDEIKAKLFAEHDHGGATYCWRGYVAEWTIIDGEIYLTNISYCLDQSQADLNAVFGSECVNGKVKAAWLTGSVLLPKGKCIHYVHNGFDSYYETEVVLTFENGVLTNQVEYDNSRSYNSRFSVWTDSLYNFIYTTIDWNIIPDLGDEEIKVFIAIYSGENRKPDSLALMRETEYEVLNQEAIRVFSELPEWDVYYKRGKVVRYRRIYPVIFNEKNRRQYAN